MRDIQIHIASYNDPLLLHTVRTALAHAAHPERLHFAIFDQQAASMAWVFAEIPRVRYLCVHPRHSKGACWARSMVATLYDGQPLVLQVDAHMHFDHHWDVIIEREFERIEKVIKKPVMSSYPPSFEIEANGSVTLRPLPRGKVLVHVPNEGTEIKEETPAFVFGSVWRDSPVPLPGIHLAGGFFLTLGQFINEVPYDPMVYFLGEEQSMSVRAFTHGWDIYHPTVMPIYHLYRKPGEVSANQHWNAEFARMRTRSLADFQARSNARLRALFYEGEPLGPFGFGHVRSLSDYARFSGIDYEARTINWDLYRRMLRR